MNPPLCPLPWSAALFHLAEARLDRHPCDYNIVVTRKSADAASDLRIVSPLTSD